METTSIVSTFRNNYTVFQLERINRVTGKEFPISGDAPLRFKFKMLSPLEQKYALNEQYARCTK